MILKGKFFSKENKLKNYFEYKKRNSISITRIISLIILFCIAFDIGFGIIEIKNMQSYIEGNKSSHSIFLNSKEELDSIKKSNKIKKLNIGNVKKIFEVIGIENLDSIYIASDKVQVIGKAKDMKTIEILMKNKILKDSYIKRIDGGEFYTFEIYSEGLSLNE